MEVAPSQVTGPRQSGPQSAESCIVSENLSQQTTMVVDAHTTRTLRYQGPDQLLSLAHEQYDALASRKTEKQILLFQPISQKEFTVLLEHIKNRRNILKLDYYHSKELLIVKIVPGWDHEYASAFLKKAINMQLTKMNLDDKYVSLSSPLVALRDGSKEPDACWIPISSPRHPSCVLEIGTSESRSCLALDAHRWLETSDPRIQTVITVCFKYLQAETDKKPLEISIWSLVHPQRITRNSIPCARQTTVLNVCRKDGSLSVSGSRLNPLTLVETETDEIRLPLESLIGRPPANPGEEDVVLTKDTVLEIFEQLLESRIPDQE